MTYQLFFRMVLRLTLIGVIVAGLYCMHYAAFGSFQIWPFLFYTNLSNLAVLLIIFTLFAQDLALLKKKKLFTENQQRCLQQIKIAFTWAISITGIVWHLVLVPAIERHIQNPEIVAQFIPLLGTINIDDLLLSMTFLHTWAPLLAFADWLLFSKKGVIKRLTPVKWLLIPAGYFVFICAWVNLIGPVNSQYNLIYPYGFIDFTENSAWVVWRNVGITGLFALVLGYLYFALDNLLIYVKRRVQRLKKANDALQRYF